MMDRNPPPMLACPLTPIHAPMPQGCLNRFPGRIADKSAEETHNLRVIVSRMITGQTCKGVDAAEPDREHLTAQHLCAFLIAFI